MNLQQNATLLSNADLNYSKKDFSLWGKDYVNDIIGDDKVNVIIAIYNQNGSILYKNENAVIFDVPNILTKFEEWEDVERKDYFIKYLTVSDKTQDRYIRVGMILNQSLLRWKDLNQRIIIYGAIIFSIIMLISFFLTFILFKPVKNLSDRITAWAEKIERGEYEDSESWLPKLKSRNKKDEFQRLLSSLEVLANKIIKNQALTQKWSALMAHELKTPMTLLKISLEELIREDQASSPKIQEVEKELNNLETIIIDFLEWASTENDPYKPEIHAISIKKQCEKIIQSVKRTHPKVEILTDFFDENSRIFCNPIHFDQLLNNLLSNAVKYGNGKVSIISSENELIIEDNGPGINHNVVENLGKPFNKYKLKNEQGHGLGLAWVYTIVKKYSWSIEVSNKENTRIKITF